VANIATGFIGGMAGCAMIGQSVINVKSGGRGRLSTFSAGIFLLLMVVFLGDWVAQIPMAALVAVMIMVSIGTFNWASFRNLREHPGAQVVMIATVAGDRLHPRPGPGRADRRAAVRVLLRPQGRPVLYVGSWSEDEGRSASYRVIGQVFFASADRFVAAFDYKEVIEKVRIDVSRAHFWDITAVRPWTRW
jgi:SulP family sulfate permease